MASIDLRLRNLETAELLIASFESEVDAALWLRERPAMMEVLGVIAQSSDPALHDALKRAARPLDAAEAAIVQRLDDEADRAYEQRLRDEEARAEADRLAHIEEVRNGDPARPFQVRWSLDGGFSPVDPVDEREINADMQTAILEWVRERDTWVADRDQVVGEAVLTVWPLAVPEGEPRVQRGGRFTPVPAPKPSEQC